MKTLQISYSLSIRNIGELISIAEYDLLLIDNNNQIYIAECKTKDAYQRKSIEAQKKLADKVGARYAKFAAITDISKEALGRNNFIDLDIKSYFLDINNEQATNLEIDSLLRDWKLIP